MRLRLVCLLPLWICAAGLVCGAGPHAAAAAKRAELLLISQEPDGHRWNMHEFRAGMRILNSCLKDIPDLHVTLADAQRDAGNISAQIDAADGVVLFVSQGAQWVGSDPQRLAAFRRLAARGGGITALHWAVGAKDAAYIDVATSLWGGCHGGPDRIYTVGPNHLVPNAEHPITAEMTAFDARDEWYYNLKFAAAPPVVPLLTATIDEQPQTVAWAWERADGGRSFGFVGLHFHENWGDETYRRFVTRGVLWTLKQPLPQDDVPLTFDQHDLAQPRPKPVKGQK